MGTALVNVQEQVYGEWQGQPLKVYTTGNLANQETKLTMLAALVGHVSILETNGKPVPIVDLVSWDAVRTDEKVGLQRVLRYLGFVALDGTVYSTTSEEMNDKITTLVQFMGQPPWAEPINMVFEAVTSPTTNRTYHRFRVVAPQRKRSEAELPF